MLVAGCSSSKGSGSSTTSAGSAASSSIPALDPNYFSGKTVNFVLGFAPGGGSDAGFRIIAKYMAKHIPGSPNVVVMNQAGAAGVTASNSVYETAKPDGLTLLTNSGTTWRGVIQSAGVRYDLNKMPLIGGLPSNYVTFQSVGANQQPAQIVSGGAKLTYAATAVDSPPDVLAELALQIMGATNLKIVNGYSGSADTLLALEKGEANVATGGLADYLSNTSASGQKAKPMWQAGVLNDSGAVTADSSVKLPTASDVIKQALGKDPSGQLWDEYQAVLQAGAALAWTLYAPPGTPQNVVTVLDKAFKDTIADPDFISAIQKSVGGAIPVYDSVAAAAIYKKITSLPAATLTQLQTLTKTASK